MKPREAWRAWGRRVPSALQSRREALARSLSERLEEDAPMEVVRELRERLQIVDEQLARSVPSASAWRRPALAMLAVAALVSIAAIVPMPRVSFALDLDAGAAQLQMGNDGSLGGDVVDGELRAAGFERLESGDATLTQRARDEGAGQLGLRAASLRLTRQRYPAGARIDMESGARSVRIAIDGAPQAAEIEVAGTVSSSLGGAQRQQLEVPVAEWIKLSSDKAPTELWLARSGQHDYRWRGLQPVALRFVERQVGADGQVRVVSSLRRGTLRLPATARELALLPGSNLVLDDLRLEQADVSLGDKMALHANGSAGRMDMTIGGFSESLKPSLLEHVAHNHALGLLWSAAGLLWGIATWLRKAFDEHA